LFYYDVYYVPDQHAGLLVLCDVTEIKDDLQVDMYLNTLDLLIS
jgi:hypothetical protein